MNRYLHQGAIEALVMALLALLGCAALAYMTVWGAGLTSDSISYIGVARNLLSGSGLTTFSGEPLTRFPPLYPIMLALAGIPVGEPLAGARWLQILLFGSTIFSTWRVLHRITGDGPASFLPFAGAALAATSAAMLLVHAMAWSEPLFLILSLWGLFFLARAAGTQDRRPLILSALLCGAALMTRYAGVSLIATGIIALPLFGNDRRRDRWIRSALWAGICLLPALLWWLRNRLVAQTASGREAVFHPLSPARLFQGVDTAAGWLFLPDRLPMWGKVLVLTMVILGTTAACGALLRRSRSEGAGGVTAAPASAAGVFLLFCLVYMLTLLISISFFDAHTPLDNRILSPLFLFGMLAALMALHGLSLGRTTRVGGVVVLVLCLALTFGQVVQAVPMARKLHRSGSGYAGRAWQASQIFPFIKGMPADTPLYTNGADALALFLNRSATQLPSIANPNTRLRNDRFPEQFREMIKTLEQDGGRLVYFNYITWRWYLPKKRHLEQVPGLRKLYDGPDGTVYGISP